MVHVLVSRIKVDCGSDTFQLITHSEELTQALTNLMVIGQAVQGLQNGDAECDSKGQRLVSSPTSQFTWGSKQQGAETGQ